MSYFSILGMEREPFSTSPDPSFLFLSREHKAALCRLQIAITLKRGLSVILGDVGMGKTTLSRKLSQALACNEDICFHMVLNPRYRTERQFLAKLASTFRLDVSPRASGLEIMESIEKFLFQRGVEEGKTIVLLIDEAQILPKFVLEILRILLNYETNEYKILQLVLVGQLELLPVIRAMQNFWDRIALKYVLNPLGEDEVRDLIDFRLKQAGYSGEGRVFTDEAVRLIWEHTRGYPRRVALCCHNALENLVMYDGTVVDGDVARRTIAMEKAVELPFHDRGSNVAIPADVVAAPDEAPVRRVAGAGAARMPRLTLRYGSQAGE